MSFWLLDKIIDKKRKEEELERKKLLEKVNCALEELRKKIKFDQAYIFGSITKPYRFIPTSDIDICFSGLDIRDFFRAWSFLSQYLAKDNIQIIRMEEIDFKDKILRSGIRWRKKD